MYQPMVSARSNLANVPDLHEMAMVPLYHAPIMAVPPTGRLDTVLTKQVVENVILQTFRVN